MKNYLFSILRETICSCIETHEKPEENDFEFCKDSKTEELTALIVMAEGQEQANIKAKALLKGYYKKTK